MSILTTISKSVQFNSSTLQPELNLQGQVVFLAASQIEVTPQGTALNINWPQISGATEIALDQASVTVLPPSGLSTGKDLGHQVGGFSGDRVKIPIPSGPRPVRSIYLDDLRLNDADEANDIPATSLNNHNALSGAGVRLAVAAELGGVLAPVSLAVPSIPGNPGQAPFTTPPLLTGASYSGYRMNLPDVMAENLWLMVVEGSDPEDFTPVSFALDFISVRAAPSPMDVELRDPESAPFFNSAGPVTGPMVVDVANAVQRALEQAVTDNASPSVELKLAARVAGQVGTYGIVASGQVLRVFDDKITVDLQGRDITPALPAPALDTRAPVTATADVVIDHHGLRLHETSDTAPLATGGESGPVITTDAPVWRTLPPEALRGEALRRVGIIGYGLSEAELSMRVLGATEDGAAIAPPDLGTAKLSIPAPSAKGAQAPAVFWFDLGQDGIAIDAPFGIEISAVSGRFLWIEQGGKSLVQLAVSHPPSAGDTVQIGTRTLTLTGPRTELIGATLNAYDFTAPPVIRSDHFATIVLSRLKLGYAP